MAKTEENITYKEFSDTGFLEDLAGAKAVICNGGLTLITEALYLGKPVLSEPIKKHFEQIINAVYLEKLGFGKYVESLDSRSVKEFVGSIQSFEEKLRNYTREGNAGTLEIIDELIYKFTR